MCCIWIRTLTKAVNPNYYNYDYTTTTTTTTTIATITSTTISMTTTYSYSFSLFARQWLEIDTSFVMLLQLEDDG